MNRKLYRVFTFVLLSKEREPSSSVSAAFLISTNKTWKWSFDDERKNVVPRKHSVVFTFAMSCESVYFVHAFAI